MVDPTKVRPMGDNILISRRVSPKFTEGGIEIPEECTFRQSCEECRGVGGKVYLKPKLFAGEDNKYLEVPCEDCNGKGYRTVTHGVRGMMLRGIVLAVGPGVRRKKDGARVPIDVEPGDEVLFYRWAGSLEPYRRIDESHVILPRVSIFAVIPSGSTTTSEHL